MLYNSTTVILFLVLFVPYLSAQSDQKCRRDFDLLKTPISEQANEFFPGSTFFLKKSYLEDLASGAFETKLSGLKHYEYLRPASRKELRQMEVEDSQIEKVFSDGNVYNLTSTSPSFHFF